MQPSEFTAQEVSEALTLTEMADELGIRPQGMNYRVKTPMFRKMVRQIDRRARRRTWHKGDFRKYKRAKNRIATQLRA